MFVAIMHTQNYEVVGCGESEDEARQAIARRFDQHLESAGDESRERFLCSCGYEEGPIPHKFGQDLAAFVRGLNGWYGIAVYELQPGEAYLH